MSLGGGIPLRQHHYRAALVAGGEQIRMDPVVLGERRIDRAGESEMIPFQAIVSGRVIGEESVGIAQALATNASI